MLLDEICSHKRDEVGRQKRLVPLVQVEERLRDARRVRDFRTALRKPGMSLIAEIKRVSPVKGMLRAGVEPVELAGLYEQGGARAISVLTDAHYFNGSIDDLAAVRQSVALPCLRKDFVVDEYQVYEARAAGADAILLIVRALSGKQLKDYLQLATELGMAALVEVHDAAEIEQALEVKARIIGINNRDLATFETDLSTTLQLRRLVPGGHVLVSESGIYTRDQVKMLEDAGVDAILVGEALLTSEDVVEKIRELLDEPEG